MGCELKGKVDYTPDKVKAYCVKCKKSVEVKNPVKTKLKNGKPATKGSCPSCGTKVFRIGK
ncbi:MAG: hypothetical protein KIY11_01000 [Thermoplasmata archaeon]|nr:hypothetical protein [Candidatus Sysuiplasma acidicola]MDH2904766.1 DUF5679 domain-containing protein [Methanomassiliicoccales archaeon]